MSVLGSRFASRSRSRSAKFELILTTRCQYQGVPYSANCFIWSLIEHIYMSCTISDSFNWGCKLELKFTLKLKIWNLSSDCFVLAVTLGIEGPVGYSGIRGLLGGVGAIWEHQGIGGVRGVLGASRDSRYSRTKRGIWGIGGLLAVVGTIWQHQRGIKGCRGVRGILGV